MAKGPQKRKKNPGVGIDFKRAKHKVGRAVPKGPNDTSVAFRSHAINLPSQSVAEDRTGVAVSSHNLTLKELLIQSSHYSERTRAAGITGLKDLLAKNPGTASRATALLLETLAPRIADSDSAVRKALLELLSELVLPEIGPDGLGPFIPLIMAHVCSAMTSLSDGIRNDALAFLATVVEAAPSAMAGRFTQPALEHFEHLLSSGQRGASIRARSLTALSKVVTGLLNFLSKVHGRPPTQQPAAACNRSPLSAPLSQPQPHGASTAPVSSSRLRNHDNLPAVRPLAWHSAALPPAPVLAEYHVAMEALQRPQRTDLPDSTGSEGSASTTSIHLVSRLLDAFGECGPATLQTAPELPSSDCVSGILKSITLLLPLIQDTDAREAIEGAMATRIAQYFPVTSPAVPPGTALRASLSAVNLAAVQLLASLLKTQQGRHQKSAPWRGRLVSFYCGALATGTTLPLHDDEIDSSLPAGVLLPETVEQVLAGIEAVLPHVSHDDRDKLLSAVGGFSQRSSPKSAARASCLALQHRLMAAFMRRTHTVPEDEWAFVSEANAITWVQALPRLIWEMGAARPGVSQLALQLLLDAARSAVPGSTLSMALQTLQPQLLPLFCMLIDPVPKRRKKAQPSTQDKDKARDSDITDVKAQPKLVVGVLAKLPPQCQEVAIDILASQGSLLESTQRTVAMLALTSAYPPSIGVRAFGMVAASAQEHAAQLPPPPGPATIAAAASASAYHSTVGALLLGSMTNLAVHDSWQRHVTIVEAACSALTCAGNEGRTWGILEPLLLQRLAMRAASGDSLHRGLYGFLRGAAAAIIAATPLPATNACPGSGHTSGAQDDPLTDILSDSLADRDREAALPVHTEMQEVAGPSITDTNESMSLTDPAANSSQVMTANISQALKEALPMLMWQYNAWLTSASQWQFASSGQSGTDTSAQTAATTGVSTVASDQRSAEPADVASSDDVAAENDAAGSPGVEPCMTLLCNFPPLLQPLLLFMASVVERGCPLTNGVLPLQGGSHQATPLLGDPSEGRMLREDSLQGRAMASLALLQAVMEDRRLTVHLLEHGADVQSVITAVSAAVGAEWSSEGVSSSARRIAKQLHLAKNTADSLFGL